MLKRIIVREVLISVKKGNFIKIALRKKVESNSIDGTLDTEYKIFVFQ